MMDISLDDVLNELPAERRERIDAEAKRVYEEYMTLQQLRKAKEMTQNELSEKLGKSQATIAQMEKRNDLMLSTLRRYVGALGGTLSLQVSFPGQQPVTLEGLGDTEEPPRKTEEVAQPASA